MTADEQLVRTFRRDQAARHNATVTIHRETSKGTLNDTTGVYDATSTSSVYSGSALILPANTQEQTPSYGGEDVNTRRYMVQIAANTDVQPDDIVTVTDGDLDDDLTDATLTVVDVEWSSRQVSRNLICLHNRGG